MAMSGILKLTRTYKSKKYLGAGCVFSSQDSQQKSGLEITVFEGVLKFQKFAKQSRPLMRPYPWL